MKGVRMTDNWDDLEPPRHMTAVAVAFEFALLMAAVVIGWVIGHSPFSTVDVAADALPDIGRACLWGAAAAVPMIVGLVLINRYPIGPLRELRHVVDRLIVPLFREATLAELALISLVAGIGEEALFRGLIQHALEVKIGPPYGLWIGLAVASLLFGLAHAITRMYVVLAALIGIYLGWLFVATDSLIAPAAAHALYDFIALAYLVRWRVEVRGQRSAEEESNR